MKVLKEIVLRMLTSMLAITLVSLSSEQLYVMFGMTGACIGFAVCFVGGLFLGQWTVWPVINLIKERLESEDN